jgi:NAD+ synthase
MHTRAKDIADWLRERVTMAGARGLVVGLSGGIDSAVVARLCQMATPDHVVGVILPCHSDPQDEADARLTATHFQIPAVRVELEPAYDLLTSHLRAATARLPAPHSAAPVADDVDLRARVPLANVKPRLRMTSLYFIANSLNYLVAGTGNRCELTIGYFTKYGDGGVDVLPIGDLLKSDVRGLARDLGVPVALIDKPPSAGLWLGQTDEAEMGFTYAQLERYLADGPEAVAPALALRIERLVRKSAHKRGLAPTPASDPLAAEP